MAGLRADTSGELTAHAVELVKQYFVYENTFKRLTDVYTATVNTVHGGVCERTEYSYDGDTSRILKRRESHANWDSSWEI